MSVSFIVNTGSTSKKYALYSANKEVFNAHFEYSDDGIIVTYHYGEHREELSLPASDYSQAAFRAISYAIDQQIILKITDIKQVAVRVVAPGTYFTKHQLIDEDYIRQLEQARELAKLHIPVVLAEIQSLQKELTGIPLYAISDSAFQVSRPQRSREYAIDYSDAEAYDIYRFGYHGLSVQSVMTQLPEYVSGSTSRVIVCHIGGGVSLTAVKDGQSLETSMGFSPLEGVVMARRSGNIDIAAVLRLAQEKGLNFEELEQYLSLECGLLGLSGKSDDIRELLSLEQLGDDRAQFALSSFVYHLKQYIGAYTAILGGLDVLIFTATVGYRSDVIRQRVCEGLQVLGIEVDSEANQAHVEKAGLINTEDASVKVVVIKTDEMSILHSNLMNII